METERANPYIGPAPFSEQDQDFFFGREQAVRKLEAFILSQSVVVLHGKSGTGKTSLLRAGLLPALRGAVWPQVKILPSVRFQDKPIDKTYLQFALAQLTSHESVDSVGVSTLVDLFQKTPPSATRDDEEEVVVLILDQFEELFTVAPEAWSEREQFADELNQALITCPFIRLLLVIREDFLADLFRLTRFLRNGIDIRYQLLPLTSHEAALAIAGPASSQGVEFTPEAVERIVSVVRESGTDEGQDGHEEFVSPLLLQLVCSRLWEQRPPGVMAIDSDMLEGRLVDSSVDEYYQDSVRSVAEEHGLEEDALHAWFERALTSGARRIPAHLREGELGQPSDGVIQALVKSHVIRREMGVHGVPYFELTHDRFVGAVQRARQSASSGDEISEEPVPSTTAVFDETETLLEEPGYTPPAELASSRRIWSEVKKHTQLGRISTLTAIETMGYILAEAANGRPLSEMTEDDVHGRHRHEPANSRQSTDQWRELKPILDRHVTTTWAAGIRDTYYWILNEAATSQPQPFNDIFTPFSIGSLMMAVLAPQGGSAYDPHCHSGELFGYLERELRSRGANTVFATAADRYQESTQVAQATLSVAGLTGEVAPRDALVVETHRGFDYVFCNPPFNDPGVDWKLIPDPLRPFGVSTNSNMAWVQHMYASLNQIGRAAFLMTSSLAKSNDSALRGLVERGAVEAVIDLGPDRLYRGVPVHLWLLNRRHEGKNAAILFIDLRSIGVLRRPRIFTDAQIERTRLVVQQFRGSSQYLAESRSDWFELDVPGYCTTRPLDTITSATELDLAPSSYVTPIPRTEPKANLRELIQRYQVQTREGAALDKNVRDALDTVLKRLL